MLSRPNCKFCNSAHRAEAERLFAASRDRKAVHRWLTDQGEVLSYNAVKNHIMAHVVAAPDESLLVNMPSGDEVLDGVAILEEMQRITLQRVRHLNAVQTDDRNVASVSSALFRGLDLLGRQVDLNARLLGHYQPVDEPTRLQFDAMLRQLRFTLSNTTDEQKRILAPVLRSLGEIGQRQEEV